jgi:hypothetical protein
VRKTPTAFAFMSLALVLASCGGPNTPGNPSATGPLVKVDVAALSGLRTQGLTGDAGPVFFNVNVRDSQNQLVAFNGTTFDPTGTGTKTLTLNLSNAPTPSKPLPKTAPPAAPCSPTVPPKRTLPPFKGTARWCA